jgi:hypothetical protein
MARPRKKVIQLGVKDIDVRGHVLTRLATELSNISGGRGPGAVSTHIKNDCDLHGKGNHIKGSGPNYLKTSDPERIGIDISNPAVDRFIDEIATRVAKKIR